MKTISYALSFLRPIRFLFAALMCTMLLLTSMAPAQAATAHKSQPTEGSVQLKKILKKSEDAAQSPPMSMKEVEKRSNEGINEVQGAADKSKMKSGDSEPVLAKELEKAMDKANKK